MGFRPGLKGSLEQILEVGKNQLHHQPPVNKPDAPVQFCKHKPSLIFDGTVSTFCLEVSLPLGITILTSQFETDDEKIDPEIMVRVYTPKEKPIGPLPLGVFGHGGGFCGGDLNSDDKTARYMAENVPCIVVSIDYRLGPKFKFPTMLNDFETGFNWVSVINKVPIHNRTVIADKNMLIQAYDNAEKLGGDQSRVFAWGCSAGGTLSCGLAKRLAEKGQNTKLIGIMNLAGGTMHPDNVPDHLRDHYKSVEENGVGVPIIDRHVMDIFNGSLHPDSIFKWSRRIAKSEACVGAINANPHDTDYAPALSKNLKDFPKTYSVACGLDPLRDDAIIMDSELKKAGVTTKIDIYPGLPHIFWVFDGLPSTKVFYENILEGAKFILS